MTTLTLPPPPPSLPVPGDPAAPWDQWITAFDDYLLAVGYTVVPDARKCAILRHCLGQEGQRIFATLSLSEENTYAAATAALKKYFSSGGSRQMHRFEFRQRTQKPGESVAQFVLALRELAKRCDFGALEDGLIVDELIEKTLCNKLRERLLLEPDSMDLACALVIGKLLESAISEARKFSRAVQEPVMSAPSSALNTDPKAAVAAVKASDSLDVQRVDRRPRESGPKGCSNGDSPNHAARDPSCPAQGKRCRQCNKQNHFARFCRSSPAHTASGAVPINSVQSSLPSFKLCTCQVGETHIPLLVDTGAKVSILNKYTYERYFRHVPLGAVAKPLSGYGHFPISTLGVACLPVRYGQQSVPEAEFCITHRGANIMGLDLFLALEFTVTDARGLRVLQVATAWPDRYPHLFKGLGHVSGFVHQPTVDPSVRPVIQPLRRVPLALRDAVGAELHRLLDEDVIEPINASPWVSNLVITEKKGGALRLCVDLTDVNKAVIPDKYPLPTAEELTSHFHGSTIFSKMDLRHGYLQVALAPASMDLTAFVTHMGVFRYKHMPFGLSSAPSCFQKIMSLILADIQGVSIFLDDVLLVERLVAFASRALMPAEQKYSVGDREALACLWACERWHVYLYGRAFTICTDHQALTALLATKGSGCYLLVVHDLHSKWPEIFPLTSITSHTIISRLNGLFGRWGLPSAITTDNGAQFTSAEFTEFLALRSIKHIRTAVYYPESNGEVERLNKTLKDGLRACLAEEKTFSDALNQTVLTIRASKHSTTGFSPALLMIGCELRQSLDCLRAEPTPARASPGLEEARVQVSRSQAQIKWRFDVDRRVRPSTLAAGDWVRIKHLHRKNKLQSYWSEPLQVASPPAQEPPQPQTGAVGWPRRPAANWAANPPSPEAAASPARAQPTQPPDMATSPAHPQGLRAQPAQTPDVAAQPALGNRGPCPANLLMQLVSPHTLRD
ncbi:hypothetical protein ACEWY4_025592 [Coilia grayii]|uniref:Reverse transcriptase n=1 Tax=Coilia grayii TaxID=363190 RepID=A0ABD1ISX0_9TELE